MADQHSTSPVWMAVEDDATLRTMLTAMMTVWGVTPLVFADGHAAMQWLDQVEANLIKDPLPQLAMLDIRIPGPQGHEIAERLRFLPKTKNVAIVIMTAYHFDPNERAMIDAMAQPDLFIRKPLPRPDDLKAMLEEAIAKRQEQQADDGMSVSLMIMLLEDEEAHVRQLMVETLGALQMPEIIDPLLKRLHDSAAWVRWTAIEAVRWYKSVKVAKALIPMLNDPHPIVRRRVCEVFALDYRPVPVKMLVRRLQDEDQEVRFWAIEGLRASSSKEALEGLIHALNDKSLMIQRQAVQALSYLGHKKAIPNLEQLAEKEPILADEIAAAIRHIDPDHIEAAQAGVKRIKPTFRKSTKSQSEESNEENLRSRKSILRMIGRLQSMGDHAPD
jgi:CheY-like chemotaxis protein